MDLNGEELPETYYRKKIFAKSPTCKVCQAPVQIYGGNLIGTPPRPELAGLVEWTYECVACGHKFIERYLEDGSHL